MKNLKFKEKYKIVNGDWTYHHRVYVHSDIPDRVFVELTTVHNGDLWRNWYCPEVHQHKGYKSTIDKKTHKCHTLGGTGGLSTWFDIYLKRRNK